MSSESAQRIVARYIEAVHVVRADHIGDLNDLLATYREKVAKFSRHEASARSIVEKYAKIDKLQWATPMPVPEMKAIRDTIPMGGEGSPDSIVTVLIQEYTGVQTAARLFCWAALQQVVLSPKVRKAIEAAAKFWSKTPRLPKAGTVEATLAKRTSLYIECIDDFQKYDKLFAIVVREGKAHITEGEGATKLKAGPFTLVNTGGFPAEVMTEKAKLCEEVAKRMSSIGLDKVCYGEVLISNKLTTKAAVAAFYIPSKDEMFVRADGEVSTETVRFICHELAHRFEHKFMRERGRVKELYDTLKGHKVAPKPKKGVQFKDGDRTFVIMEVSADAIVISSGPGKMGVVSPAEYYKMVTPGGYQFVTGYAEKGGPGENFAEMVSFYAMGKLPKEQLELLKPLLE